MAEEKEDKGFVIKDRRIFSEKGDDNGEEPAAGERDRPSEKKETSQNSPQEESDAGPAKAQSTQAPEVDFAGFIISLYTSAALHLGDMTDPATGTQEKNLPAAKQMIDILALLKDKTRGNLDDNETQLIEGLLYELRMRYVKEK